MVVLEQKSAAKALGITDRALREWIKQPGFPDITAGYDLDAIKTWRESQQKKGSVQTEQNEMINRAIKLAKLDEIKKKNQLLDLQIAEEEGRLLPRLLYEGFIASLLAGVGDFMDQLPVLVEGEVPQKYRSRLRSRLEEELRALRDRLAEDLKRDPGA